MHEEHLHGHRHADMISVEDARSRILDRFAALEPQPIPIAEAAGMVAAEDAASGYNVPPWDNSAMDGYAVRAKDIESADADAPATLPVVGVIAAGDVPSRPLRTGEAMRIMTGAPLPQGADAVTPFEDTDERERRAEGRSTGEISIRVAVPRGGNTRPAGGDIALGQTVVSRGSLLRSPHIGALASVGRSTVSVHRRPLVAIVATGNELIEPSELYLEGRIYNSNSYAVSAATRAAGGVPKRLGIARDTVESISGALETAMADADLVITTAGVSKGDYDLVKDVLAQHGRIELWSVRMRPAKPLAFGILRAPDGRRVPLLGLPGNPVSALVAFEQFARPAIYKMMGRFDFDRPTLQVTLEEPIHNHDGRRVYARAIVFKRGGAYFARLAGGQSSNVLTALARANALAICPEDVPVKRAGDVVSAQMIDWPESVF